MNRTKHSVVLWYDGPSREGKTSADADVTKKRRHAKKVAR